MKIIVKEKSGVEKLVCESVGEYHGQLIVSLLNGNYASKVREEDYKLVDMEYKVDNTHIINPLQMNIDEFVDK